MCNECGHARLHTLPSHQYEKAVPFSLIAYNYCISACYQSIKLPLLVNRIDKHLTKSVNIRCNR